jgi:hypothetical protein
MEKTQVGRSNDGSLAVCFEGDAVWREVEQDGFLYRPISRSSLSANERKRAAALTAEMKGAMAAAK